MTKAPLLLLPGLLCDEHLWDRVAEPLGAVADVLAIDLSQAPSIQAMAAAALAVAPPRFSVVGFSMGSQVALELCRLGPGRVERLCLMSANAYGLTPLVREKLTVTKAQIADQGMDAYLADAFKAYFVGTGADNAGIRERFTLMGRRLGPTVALRQIDALLQYPGFQRPLSSMGVPTTLICGELDARTPVALHRRIAVEIGNATVNVIPGSGHFTMLEAPTPVANLLVELCTDTYVA